MYKADGFVAVCSSISVLSWFSVVHHSKCASCSLSHTCTHTLGCRRPKISTELVRAFRRWNNCAISWLPGPARHLCARWPILEKTFRGECQPLFSHGNLCRFAWNCHECMIKHGCAVLPLVFFAFLHTARGRPPKKRAQTK